MRGDDVLTPHRTARRPASSRSITLKAALKSLDRAIRAFAAVAKKTLSKPWVEISLLTATFTMVSWFYLRRIGEQVAGSDKDLFDVTFLEANLGPSEAPAAFPGSDSGVSLSEGLGAMVGEEVQTDALPDFAERAAQLATALERSIQQAAHLDSTVAAQELLIQCLEQENRMLLEV
ncbi:hypothetical protein HKX48_000954 [Thoreauomyces humboldtii]|nr:hypothetical protein HKX48_000954 [Thoreauomyces humboldtii]